ncbi:hypothetical protein [Haladaptatus caseinilyticus]|uniref:hypothetical protein n=1 Tax=Haladaptatus caseinilyticus TaxID=2993314 RepID=UPI00224B8A1A|nr:hypothetical protein [Haladaptatus caseinilyticus]
MKYETNSLPERTPTLDAVRRALVVLLALALGGSAVVVIAFAYIYGAELLGGNLAVILVCWVASIGIAVMLPFLVVRTVSRILQKLES